VNLPKIELVMNLKDAFFLFELHFFWAVFFKGGEKFMAVGSQNYLQCSEAAFCFLGTSVFFKKFMPK